MSSFLGGGGGGGGASGIAVANSNITWYVSPTGNDANDGLSSGTAFATHQHAVNVAVNTNFQNLYQGTIKTLNGTYSGVGLVAVPPLLNATQLNFQLDQTGTPANVVIDWLFKVQVDPAQTVSFDHACATVSGTFPFFVDSGTLSMNQCQIKYTCPSGLFAFFLENATELEGLSTAVIDLTSNSFDFTAISQLQSFCSGCGTLTFADNQVIFAATPFTIAGGAWLQIFDGSYYRWHHPLYTNVASVTGKRLRGYGNGIFVSFNGAQADAPGDTDGPTSSNFVLQADHLVAGTNTLTPISGNSLAGNYTAPPTPLNVPSASGGTGDMITNSWMVCVDRTNGQRWLAVNDGGANPANTAVVGTVYVKQIGRVPNLQTASYTLALIDQDGRLEMNNAGANTLTVPLNATVAFPIGTEIKITQVGAGATTIAGAGGVTVNAAGVVGGQWKTAVLYKRGINEWVQTSA
jgi:hypothetical protein